MFSAIREVGYKYAPLTTQETDIAAPYWDDDSENMRFELQELVTKEQSHRRRTWLILGLLALIVLVAVVAVLAVTAGGGNTSELSARLLGNQPPAISLQDFLEGKLVPHLFNASWVSGDELLYRDSVENIVLHNVKTDKVTILLAADQVPLGAFEYELSGDRQYLLIAHNYQKLYSRYSFIAQYTIVEIATSKPTPLKTSNGQILLQLAAWAPVGNAIVYITNNNIYYRPSAIAGPEMQITDEGETGRIYFGVPDWVYEEEVLSSNKAFWWSPKGRRLAYIALNDSNVGVMSIPIYGQIDDPRFQYTKYIPLKYPKAGTPNPSVSLITIDLDFASSAPLTQKIEPPNSLGSEPILSAVAWADDNKVSMIWLNRIQNRAVIDSCDATASKCETVITIEEPNGWLEMFTPPMFSQDGSKFLLIMSQDQGARLGSYRHVTMIENAGNGKVTPLTRGTFVVTDILSWDEARQLVYFLGTSETDPAAAHLYSVSTADRKIICISCSVQSTTTKKPCSYNAAVFSKDSSYYTLNCAGPSVPEITVYNSDNKRVRPWEMNEELTEYVEDKQIPKFKKMKVEIAGGLKAHVLLQLPPNMDTSGEVKYPMVINVYGGPDSFSVVNKFGLNWFSYLASNKSIIVASIDGRGSGLKGDKMLFSGYGHLGTVEIFDQINVTRHLQKVLPYVDNTRTAIWGWSYGGYASGMALAADKDNVFKCGISIAPVTDWTLYDSIYTERFMGIPKGDRLPAYKEASLLNKVEKLKNKEYLLIHGTQDDNVHYQQSMFLARALELNDIQFRQQSYPDEDHGLTSVRKHLYHTFENFLDDCFEPNSAS